MGQKVQFGFMVGKPLSGKTTLANIMHKNHGFTIIDMKDITQKLKDAKGTEDGPFEGDIPLDEVETAIMKQVTDGAGQKFIFDDYIHPTEE